MDAYKIHGAVGNVSSVRLSLYTSLFVDSRCTCAAFPPPPYISNPAWTIDTPVCAIAESERNWCIAVVVGDAARNLLWYRIKLPPVDVIGREMQVTASPSFGQIQTKPNFRPPLWDGGVIFFISKSDIVYEEMRTSRNVSLLQYKLTLMTRWSAPICCLHVSFYFATRADVTELEFSKSFFVLPLAAFFFSNCFYLLYFKKMLVLFLRTDVSSASH